MVCHNLIPAIVFFDLIFYSGFTVLGIDGDLTHLHTEEGFDKAALAWITNSMQQTKEAFPKWIKEVREIYGRYH